MLVVTLIVLALALSLLLWGITTFLQGWMYQSLADRLPVRAAIAGLGVAIYLTFWTFVNTRADSENKYGIILDFAPTSVREVTEFQAVRYYRIPPEEGKNEVTAKFVRDPTGEYKDNEGNPFRLVSSDFMTTAIIASDKNKAELRFDAQWQTPVPADPSKRTYQVDKLFKEKSGSFVMADKPWVINTPSSGAIFWVIVLHVVLFVVWFAAFWPALRFTMLHSAGLAFLFGLLTIAVMPLVFKKNTKPELPIQKVAIVLEKPISC